METFAEKYCALQRCTPGQFRRRMFWTCLHRRILPLAPFVLLVRRNYFTPDFALIDNVGASQDMHEIWNHTRTYFSDPSHRHWLRRSGGFRISAHQLIKVASQYLPAGAKPLDRGDGLED